MRRDGNNNSIIGNHLICAWEYIDREGVAVGSDGNNRWNYAYKGAWRLFGGRGRWNGHRSHRCVRRFSTGDANKKKIASHAYMHGYFSTSDAHHWKSQSQSCFYLVFLQALSSATSLLLHIKVAYTLICVRFIKLQPAVFSACFLKRSFAFVGALLINDCCVDDIFCSNPWCPTPPSLLNGYNRLRKQRKYPLDPWLSLADWRVMTMA